LNVKKTTTYYVGNPGPGLGQVQKWSRVKLVNGMATPTPPLLEHWNYIGSTDLNKPSQLCFNLKTPHATTKMNDKKYLFVEFLKNTYLQ
jgi:hypothetical protein